MMPIALTRKQTSAMTARFTEAADLVAAEFTGLDRDGQYRNAFARVMKWDPLGRVLMMGTDQRDLFLPLLREIATQTVRAEGLVLDIGCGDGQTFALMADALPRGTTVAYADPNPDYVSSYGDAIDRTGLRHGVSLVAGFDELDVAAISKSVMLPADGSVDLLLALHMIYFLPNLEAALRRMYRFLRPAGALVVIVADEAVAYTGAVLEAHASSIRSGCDGLITRQRKAVAERQRLLNGELAAILTAAVPDSRAVVETIRQPSRLYGHSIADVVAIANIASLMEVDDIAKFEAVVALLQDTPERVDLRIEDEGPRLGMLSVAQPQTITIVRRLA